MISFETNSVGVVEGLDQRVITPIFVLHWKPMPSYIRAAAQRMDVDKW